MSQNYTHEFKKKLARLHEEEDRTYKKAIEARSAELALVMKHAATYRQLKLVYDRYRQFRDKEKLLRGHESEIILF